MSQGTVLIVVVVLAVLALVVAVWIVARKVRSNRLRGRFGPEYDKTVARFGDPRKAEDAREAHRSVS